jgi:C-terminal processing protease CtpA/Prc
MRRMAIGLASCLLVLCLGIQARADSRAEQNLRAFARLYGYVKYFHPSDEASSIDWNVFAVYGSETARRARDHAELRALLSQLFKPLAPSLVFADSAEELKQRDRPPSALGDDHLLVSWQHQGDGLDATGRSAARYRSVRVVTRLSAVPMKKDVSETWISQDRLFDQHPRRGEAIDREVSPGLWVRVPLTVDADRQRTLPIPDSTLLVALRKELNGASQKRLEANDENVRSAAVLVAWNALQHFYPYFELADTNWDEALGESLSRSFIDKDEKDLHETLSRLTARLRDGHAGIYHQKTSMRGWLPWQVDDVEGQIVITAAANGTPFQRGDLIIALDGVPARRILEDARQLLSGSPQWTRSLTLQLFGTGEPNSVARVTLQRDGATVEATATRGAKPFENPGPAFQQLEGGVYYVNLTKVTRLEWEANIKSFAQAPGVVLDLRGYPADGFDIMGHLLDAPVLPASWNIPWVIYPDRERIVGYDTSGRKPIQPSAPRFLGKVVFLTNAAAISYSETILGVVEHYKLAEIVGEPTAGTNGNINIMSLPGGFTMSWTGMLVRKHDESQHHLMGIRPTLPVVKTLKGIRESRDEVLDEAVALIRKHQDERRR